MLPVLASKSLSIFTGVARNSVLCCSTQRNNRPFSASVPLATTSKTRAVLRGIDYVKDPSLNKMLAFTLQERQALRIHGLLPPACKTMQDQLKIVVADLNRYKNPLNKYLFLTQVHDTNEKLFFNLLASDIEGFMPLVYTPTVGLACQKFGIAYNRPRGLYVSIHDRGHIHSMLKNWPETDVRAICFTDGERILGLGDLGAYGMGIPIGKLILYTCLGSIPPHQLLPIMLDVGTNNKSLITDPLYVGLRIPRVTGQEYYDFVQEFIEACKSQFGHNILLQFEDFALPHAAPLLSIYQSKCCTFNDDIQGTASVAVAGLLAAERITGKKMSQSTIMFLGAGSAACGIAGLCMMAMMSEGLSEKEAVNRIYLIDIDGLLTTKRKGGVPENAKIFGRDLPEEKDFAKCVATYKPTILIGVSTVGGAFKPEILKQMAQNTERPVIFALSNPTSKAECTAQQAYEHTEGKCVFASGSPFPPVKFGDKEYLTGQGNNSYIFPGVALGVIAVDAITIPDILFLEAAKCLAQRVKQSDLDVGRVYPPLKDIPSLSLDIATHVAEQAYKLKTEESKPSEMEDGISNNLHETNYLQIMPYEDKDMIAIDYNDSDAAGISDEAPLVPVAEKVDMEVVLREVEKSKLYFDGWMCLVQMVTYYYILNPV